MINRGQYNVTYWIENQEEYTSESKVLKDRVEFAYDSKDYGNGTYLAVWSPNDFTPYDIRYDTNYSPDSQMVYLTQFYCRRYSGEGGAWKLTGIRIHEADFTALEEDS